MSSAPPAPAHASLRPFGWAGLLLSVPDNCRLARVQGNERLGKRQLEDETRARFEINWATVYRRRFDAQNFALRHLRRTVSKQRAAKIVEHARQVANRSFEPMLVCADDEEEIDHYVGYAPKSQRVVSVAVWRVNAREDLRAREQIMPRLTDQPPDQPRRWAFFDVSFIAPAGYRYVQSTLNVGDMQVVLSTGGARINSRVLNVRQIYPADLARKRQSPQQWMRQCIKPLRPIYVPRRRLGLLRRPLILEPVATSRGPGERCRMTMRWRFRPWLLRAPYRYWQWLVHDQPRNRLLAIGISHKKATIEPTFQAVLDGLHWAQTEHHGEEG